MKRYEVRLTGVLIAEMDAENEEQAKELAAGAWEAIPNILSASPIAVRLDWAFDGTENIVEV